MEGVFFLEKENSTSAKRILSLPSKWKGFVTIPTVRMPFALAALAITGAEPVPVPPPMPAVINTIYRINQILTFLVIGKGYDYFQFHSILHQETLPQMICPLKV